MPRDDDQEEEERRVRIEQMLDALTRQTDELVRLAKHVNGGAAATVQASKSLRRKRRSAKKR